MVTAPVSLDTLCINTLRTLAMDAVQKADSGHPGTPMGAAPMAYALWTRWLRHNPSNPDWPDRDRFVLSAGHASMLLYSLLYLTGYDLGLEDIEQFRQWDSRTPGHPEGDRTPGVELTTGPLGAGFGNGVGMAIAERFLAAHFNRPGHPIVDHRVYAICSDGDMMEGVSSEAASIAGFLGLDNLTYLYDANHISIEGSTDLTFTEDVGLRFEAYGWHVQHVDGNDWRAVDEALGKALAVRGRPQLIIARTDIAYGSPHKQDSAEAHGSPLGEEEVRLTKRALGWPENAQFYVPAEAKAEFGQALERGQSWEQRWNERFARYEREFPTEARAFKRAMARELPPAWERAIPTFDESDGATATRSSSGKVLNALAHVLPTLIGGAGDLAPSTRTHLDGYEDFNRSHPEGRNFHFGVREHAMGNIVNGMALHGGVIPFGATFLIFSDYMRPAIRLAALQECHSIFVFTHDSVALGEDGPTHQPVEHLASLRAMPNLTVIRPADANETAAAWQTAIGAQGPVALALTRQGVPLLPEPGRVREAALRGAYILIDGSSGDPQVILIGTGSEVSLALAARDELEARGIPARVVSMPSWELFAKQPAAYHEEVLPRRIRARVAVEAAATLGWERWVGDAGEVVGIDHFGASAPGKVVLEKFGLTAAAVTEAALRTLHRVAEGE